MSALSEELTALAGTWTFAHTPVQISGVDVPNLLVAANPLRWGIIITYIPNAGTPNSYVILAITPNFSMSQGIILHQGERAEYDYRDWGGWVGQNWYAITSSGGPDTVVVDEILAQQ